MNDLLKTTVSIPQAKIINKELSIHNDTRIDSYFWLNDRDDKNVIDYLNAENSFFEESMAHTKDFQKDLFEEMKARIKEDESSVPYKHNGYWYITRFEKGSDYPIYTRKKETLDAPEEILLDGNVESKGHEYFKVRGLAVSPDNTMMSYGVDTVSRREYVIKIKNLITGEHFSETIKNTTGSSTWANDNKTIFYTLKDKETLRSYQICRHVLNTDSSDDVVVYEEEDDTFDVFVYKTKSKKYICIGSSATLTSEYRFVKADTPTEEFQIFQERIRGLEYGMAHYDGHIGKL